MSLTALMDIPQRSSEAYRASLGLIPPPYLGPISKASETREKKKAYLCLKQLKGVLAVDLRRLPLC